MKNTIEILSYNHKTIRNQYCSIIEHEKAKMIFTIGMAFNVFSIIINIIVQINQYFNCLSISSPTWEVAVWIVYIIFFWYFELKERRIISKLLVQINEMTF